jgi:hypothetical protein
VDDMADYLTSASQYFGESMIKGATAVAGGITTYDSHSNTSLVDEWT